MNELTFEDKEGQEEIFIHAEKDRNEKTNNNHTERIDNNWVQSVGHVSLQEVEYVKQTYVGGNYNIRIGSKESIGPISQGLRNNMWGLQAYGYQIGAKGSRPKPKGNFSLKTEGNQFFEAGNNIVLSSEMSLTISSDDDMSLDTSQDLEVSSSGNFSEAIGKNKYVRAGNNIHFVCGDSKISMKKSGEIIIIGKNVAIHASNRMEFRANTLRGKISQLIQLISKSINLN